MENNTEVSKGLEKKLKGPTKRLNLLHNCHNSLVLDFDYVFVNEVFHLILWILSCRLNLLDMMVPAHFVFA